MDISFGLGTLQPSVMEFKISTNKWLKLIRRVNAPLNLARRSGCRKTLKITDFW